MDVLVGNALPRHDDFRFCVRRGGYAPVVEETSTRVVWPLSETDTRQLVESLIRTHSDDWPLDLLSASDPDLASVVWPLCHQTFRFAAAALALVDTHLAHEAHVLIRCALEYAVTAHYLEQLGPEGADTWIASQRVEADRTLNLAMASMPLDEAIRTSVEEEAATVATKSALDGFLEICRELNLMPVYGWWALESVFVHPRSITQNVFLNVAEANVSLRHEPHQASAEARDTLQSFALILLWAGVAKERLKARPVHLETLFDIYAMIDRPLLPAINNRPTRYAKRRPRTKGWTALKTDRPSA